MSDRPTTSRHRENDHTIVYRRDFACAVPMLFSAHTDPELFVRWMGPTGTTCSLDRFDAVTGGAFDYTVGGGGGQGYRFFGSYHQVREPELIVHTWEFAGDPGRPTVESMRFVATGDATCRLEGRSLYGSAEHCAEMFEFDQTGDGMDENFERLDELFRSLR